MPVLCTGSLTLAPIAELKLLLSSSCGDFSSTAVALSRDLGIQQGFVFGTAAKRQTGVHNKTLFQ